MKLYILLQKYLNLVIYIIQKIYFYPYYSHLLCTSLNSFLWIICGTPIDVFWWVMINDSKKHFSYSCYTVFFIYYFYRSIRSIYLLLLFVQSQLYWCTFIIVLCSTYNWQLKGLWQKCNNYNIKKMLTYCIQPLYIIYEDLIYSNV